MGEIISGRNPVREVLRSGQKAIIKIFVSRRAHGAPVEEIIRLAKDRNVPVHHVPPEKLDTFCAGNNQGVAAEVAAHEWLELDELWNKIKDRERPVVVLLDGIEDPRNVGAIIRSAEVFGADGVIFGKWHSPGLTDTVAKSSAGALEHIPAARVTNIAQAVLDLKEMGFWVVGAEADGKPLTEEQFGFPLAIVIGSEGEGLHRLVKERCDLIVSIPQAGAVSSLNASCAASIILYSVFLQKTGK